MSVSGRRWPDRAGFGGSARQATPGGEVGVVCVHCHIRWCRARSGSRGSSSSVLALAPEVVAAPVRQLAEPAGGREAVGTRDVDLEAGEELAAAPGRAGDLEGWRNFCRRSGLQTPGRAADLFERVAALLQGLYLDEPLEVFVGVVPSAPYA